MTILSESLVVDILVVIVCLLGLLYYYLTSTYNYWRDRGVPYAKPILVFGNIKDILLGRKSVIEIHTNLYKQFEGERFAGYYIFRRPVLLVRDTELIERILVKDFAHFHDRGMTTDPEYEPLTMNLFNAKGQLWRNLRYKLTPTFTSGKLKGMFEQIYNCGEVLLQELQKYAESGEEVEAKRVFALFTTDVIASCAFGLQLKAGSEEAETFKTMMNKLFAPSITQMLRFNMRALYPRLTRWLGVTTFSKEVNEYFLNITKATIQLREKQGIQRNDFVQLLMNLKDQENSGKAVTPNEMGEEDEVLTKDGSTGKNNQMNNDKLFTDDCISAQTFVFLTAGSESSSGALSFVLYLLAKNPEIQQKTQAEIDQVFAKQKKWDYQALKDMIYLDQVIQEGMRMFPIATFLSRDCTETYKLPGTDIVLEKGQRITIPVPALQNDARNYPNPEVFDPERFRDNNHKPSAIYLPFGDGPRICIAMRFAILEMKVCLARVLFEYSVSLSEKTEEPIRFVPGSFFPQVLGGVWVKFLKRESKIDG